jgi:Arc/MetJ family transcription regulator
MRTTINVDDTVFEDLMHFTQARTRTRAVNQALTEWVRQQRIERLRALRGRLHIDTDLDALRQREVTEMETIDG